MRRLQTSRALGRRRGVGAVVAITLLVAGACARRAAHDPPAADVTGSVTGSVTLQRTGCFGRCPEYSVRVGSDGGVRFIGRSNVAVPNESTASVPAADAQRLLEQFADAGFFTLDSTYVAGKPTCRFHATDLPSAMLDVTIGARSHRVLWDTGCSDAPAALGQLANRVDSVAVTARWIGSTPRSP